MAWLSARGDLVAGLAAFLAVAAYLRGTRAGYWTSVASCSRWRSRGKSMPVMLPLVLLVLDVYPLRRLGPSADGWWSPSARRVYLEKAPFLALSAAAAFLAVVARIEFRSLAEVTEVGWGARLAASLYALVFPLWKTVVPVGLSPLYDLPRGPGPRPRAFCLGRYRRRRSHGPRDLARPPLAGLCGGVDLLCDHAVACIGPRPERPQIAADRYTYLAGGGWALLAGGGLAWCAAQVMARSPRAALARGVLGLTVAATVALVSASAWQALIWHNSITLWSRAVELEPDGALSRTGLGTALLAEDRPREAAVHYRRALEIFPRLPRRIWDWR